MVMAKQFNDGDVCQAQVVSSHSFYRNDKGTHVIDLPCEIISKARDNENPDEGYDKLDPTVKRSIKIYISPKAKNMAIKNLKIVGFDRDKVTVADINPASETVYDFTGKVFQVTVKDDATYGLKFEIGGGAKIKPSAESLAQLEDLFSDAGDEDPFADK